MNLYTRFEQDITVYQTMTLLEFISFFQSNIHILEKLSLQPIIVLKLILCKDMVGDDFVSLTQFITLGHEQKQEEYAHGQRRQSDVDLTVLDEPVRTQSQ